MARLRVADNDRPTTTTRVYQDTLRILKVLAEAQDRTLADYIDQLARQAAVAVGERVREMIASFGSDQAKGRKR